MIDLHEDARAEALRELLTHPGYALLREFAQQEWGDTATVARMRAEPNRDKRDRLLDAREIVEALMTWPTKELHRLGAAARQAALDQTAPLVPRRA